MLGNGLTNDIWLTLAPWMGVLAAPTAPVLTLTSGTSDNTPDFVLTGDLAVNDVVRFQSSTAADFTGATDIVNTITAPEDAANELDFSTGTLADGTWFFRARTERPGHLSSGWSNTVTETIAATVAATTWDPAHELNGTFSNANRTVTYTIGGNNNMAVRSVSPTVANQKVHIEHVITHVSGNAFFGFTSDSGTPAGGIGGINSPSTAFYVQLTGSFLCVDSVDHASGVIAACTTGDRILIEFDTQAGTAKFAKNGGTKSAAMHIPFAGPYYAVFDYDALNTDAVTTNFATADFVDTPTAGYTQLAA